MSKTYAEKQAITRANKRKEGYILKQIWVKPNWWKKVKDLISELDKN